MANRHAFWMLRFTSWNRFHYNARMKTVNIILMGYGRVGQAFLRMAGEKRALLEDRHDLHLQFSTILELRGALHFPRPLSPDSILKDLSLVQSFRMSQYWRPGFDLVSALDKSAPGVLVDCTPSKAGNAMPESGYLHQAFERKWHVVTANKGPLVADLRGLVSKAKQNTVALKISGATAAALPTVDVGFYSLAGTRVYRIEGILNGTTNYILTRMSGGADYRDALKEAQEKGITEPDPSLDLEGWDTAFKLLLITNTVCDTDFTLDDVKVEGIMNMPG
ncbi:MAG: hypothetical protein FJY81_04685, partial [Candidatus Aminicenantes bacterium]|nr:hypothetical protein [Candidatus Aminicenantes bacterium]